MAHLLLKKKHPFLQEEVITIMHLLPNVNGAIDNRTIFQKNCVVSIFYKVCKKIIIKVTAAFEGYQKKML